MENEKQVPRNPRRLIDANALIDVMDESKLNNPHSPGMVRVNHRNEHDHFLRMILDAPTVDAVEVVRCKNCKYWGRLTDGNLCGECNGRRNGLTEEYTTEDDFCSYGERKEERI